jgi:hypothetical protein
VRIFGRFARLIVPPGGATLQLDPRNPLRGLVCHERLMTLQSGRSELPLELGTMRLASDHQRDDLLSLHFHCHLPAGGLPVFGELFQDLICEFFPFARESMQGVFFTRFVHNE